MKIKSNLLFFVLLFNIGMSQNAIAALPMNCATQSYIPEEECDALLDFYHSTNDSEWTNHHNWGTYSDPCTAWYGVTCEVSLYCIPPDYFICYPKTHVTFLSLDENNLSGSIPSSMGNLTNLKYLWLMENELSGSIPYEIGNLINLQGLHLNDNLLCGEIPTSLTNLINLDEVCGGIDIKNNYLYTNNATLDAFLILKGGDWESTQGARCPADSEKTLLYQIIMGASQD